jgi:hypothetical protein
VIQPSTARVSAAVSVKFQVIVVLLQMSGIVHPASPIRIRDMIVDFVKVSILSGIFIISDTIVHELYRCLFPGTAKLLATDRADDTLQVESTGNMQVDLTLASKQISAVSYIKNDVFSIPRSGWEEILGNQLDGEWNGGNLFSDRLQLILTLQDVSEGQLEILSKANWRSVKDLCYIHKPEIKQELLVLGLRNKVIESFENYLRFALDKFTNKEVPPDIMDMTPEDWISIQRENYEKHVEKDHTSNLPEQSRALEVKANNVSEYINQLKVKLPPLLLFFWMGDDLFGNASGQASVPQWCPLVQLKVNNRVPDLDNTFQIIRDGLFEMNTQYDFTEEYVVLPYIRDYQEKETKPQSATVKPTIHEDSFIEGCPSGKSMEKSEAMVKDLYWFATGEIYDDIHKDSTSNNSEIYLMFGKANVRLASKYGNFGTIEDIVKMHDDLCRHIFVNIPCNFFYLIPQGTQGIRNSEQSEAIQTQALTDQAFNDLMRRTLFLFKTAFGMDCGILDGGNRCLALKTAILNIIVDKTAMTLAQDLRSIHEENSGSFLLLQGAKLAPVTIVWPSWDPPPNKLIYNWKVSPKNSSKIRNPLISGGRIRKSLMFSGQIERSEIH